MSASVNRVVLLGRLNHRGIELRHGSGGTPCASFAIDLTEVSNTGQEFTCYINCEAWGKKSEGPPARSPLVHWCSSRAGSSA
jgi:single-stranded DNA-binding protein